MVAWKVGGDQGEGIESTGEILSTVLSRLGYYIYGYRHFSSRIKGGHTHFKVRIDNRPVEAPCPETHILVALTQETIDRNEQEMVPGGVILADDAFQPRLPAGSHAVLGAIPLTRLAREAGGVIMRNMVAAGASAYLLGLPLDAFRTYVTRRFASKGDEVIAGNLRALESGYAYAQQELGHLPVFPLPPADGRSRPVLSGNQCIALGALAAGCRIMAGYPITPASEIMEYLMQWFPAYGGVVMQMEDELASISLAIGAGFAGARAMTATSGPGLSLMQEAIGLAGMTETPVVIVDTQRSGPSTGMPTKHEQSDLHAMVHGGHGEAPRIVLTPGSPAEAFQDMVLAFNLADRFQCPVIVASDLALSLWTQTVESLPVGEVTVDRGEIVSDQVLQQLGKGGFLRYAFTETGISPRSLPGQKYGQFLATGAEHGPTGRVLEDPDNRARMMRKRWDKLRQNWTVPGVAYEGPSSPSVLLVGFGSNVGTLREARERLAQQGVSAGLARIRVLSPFPTRELEPLLERADHVYVVENNATGQLVQLMGEHGLPLDRVHSVLKYDGTLFYPGDVVHAVLEGQSVQEVLR